MDISKRLPGKSRGQIWDDSACGDSDYDPLASELEALRCSVEVNAAANLGERIFDLHYRKLRY